MNSPATRLLVLLVTLLAGFAWMDAQAGKPVKITVTEAIPAEGIQGQALGVRIKGTGFDHGSQVRFLVSGTPDDSQINVGAVSFDAATGDLIAEVQVKDQALVVEYDVEVKNSSGRRGKGTTLFRVRYRAEEDPCVTNTTYFPAFAYVQTIEGSKQDSYLDIHIASADALCDVVIYSGEAVPSGSNLSYRYYDNGDGTGTGKIAWAKNRDTNEEGSLPVIRMLKFHVAGRQVTDVLPVQSELLIQHTQSPYSAAEYGRSWRGNVAAPDLAPDGDRLVYYGYEDWVNFYLAELDLIGCASPPCVSRFFETINGEERYPTEPKYSLSWPRIYFRMHKDADGLYAFGYVDKVSDTWSEPVLMKIPGPLFSVEVGLWDWDGDGYSEEVLAVSSRIDGDYLIELWGCLEPGETPCKVLTGITGRDATIKAIDGNPSLIYRHIYAKNTNRHGPALFEYDLVTGETRMLVDEPGGHQQTLNAVDAAD